MNAGSFWRQMVKVGSPWRLTKWLIVKTKILWKSKKMTKEGEGGCAEGVAVACSAGKKA